MRKYLSPLVALSSSLVLLLLLTTATDPLFAPPIPADAPNATSTPFWAIALVGPAPVISFPETRANVPSFTTTTPPFW